VVLLAARVCLRAVEGLLLADDERGDAGHQEAKARHLVDRVRPGRELNASGDGGRAAPAAPG
jgi:hypothetical protein